MDKIVIEGGHSLKGEVQVSGAKNAILPLLFSTLLAKGKHHFQNVPRLADVEQACKLLEIFGCEYYWEGSELIIQTGDLKTSDADYEIVRKMRASFLCMGPLLARHGHATVSMPGGCAIGSRPIDLHLDAFALMGATIENQAGYVNASAKPLKGASILFDITTVGGTENVMMAACLAQGTTIIENAAKEPEIVDLAKYLIAMGANIKGAGTSVMQIEGVKTLTPTKHSVIPDRIEAGTLLIAGAITGGDVKVKGCIPADIETLIHKMKEAGFTIDQGADWVRVHPLKKWRAVDVTTSAHPGFATDLQAQFMALMTVAEGTAVITETIFENRFMHVQELVRLGANIKPKSRVAIIRGAPGQLVGAPVMATDLRASASLVLAGPVAKGTTEVLRIYHLDRGYENLEKKLSSLGAKIERVKA